MKILKINSCWQCFHLEETSWYYYCSKQYKYSSDVPMAIAEASHYGKNFATKKIFKDCPLEDYND